MWSRLIHLLCCPICGHALDLHPFCENTVDVSSEFLVVAQRRQVLNDQFNRYVEAGLLICEQCRHLFPILYGLPILLPYTTPMHHEFAAQYQLKMAPLSMTHTFPALPAVSGEKFVMNSFSKEWLGYEYDGVIWDLSYEDHERRFLSEIGREAAHLGRNGVFLEVGCGLGVTTHFAYKNLEADAIGFDLSLAVLKAAQHFRTHPFLHFVQGSAFYPPFRNGIADVVYSHGVLHHTFSTRAAFKAIAPCCGPSGILYVWVYGPDSQKGNLLRRAAYHLETLVRPVIAQNPQSIFSRIFLNVMSYGYLAVNWGHRVRNPAVQAYTVQRAAHAARDRFTPLYAHRHDHNELTEWFRDAGFRRVELVDWRSMPSANRDNFRRNTAIRGWRLSDEIATAREMPGL